MIKNILCTTTKYIKEDNKPVILERVTKPIDDIDVDDIIKMVWNYKSKRDKGFRTMVMHSPTKYGNKPSKITISNIRYGSKTTYELNYKESKLSGRGITRSKESIQ